MTHTALRWSGVNKWSKKLLKSKKRAPVFNTGALFLPAFVQEVNNFCGDNNCMVNAYYLKVLFINVCITVINDKNNKCYDDITD